MITINKERMAEFFCKYHIEGLPISAVIHHFADVDCGDPHSHPWPFTSFILYGGYVERVFQLDGSNELVHRKAGDSFQISADHIHRIEQLPEGECYSLVLPGPHEQTSGFYQFRDDGTWFRFWHEHDWRKI